MGYKPTITNISAFDATKGTTIYFGWKGNAAFANELIIKNSKTLKTVYKYKVEQMGLYHEMNIAEGTKGQEEAFVNNNLYQATLIIYDKYNNVISDESDPITFWCFSTPTFEITNDFVKTGIATMASLYLTFKYKQDENEALSEYTVMLYNSNNQLLHQSKTFNTSISDGNLVYKIEGLQNTDGYKVCVEGKTVHGMKISTGYVSFSIKFDKMGVGSLVNLKDIGDGKISIGSNFKILDAKAYPDPPKYINNEEVDLRKPGSYVEFDNGFVVDGNYECKIAFRAPSVGNLYTMTNAQGDIIRLSYNYYDIYNEENDDFVRKYYFKLNVSGKNTDINIFSNMFDALTYGQKVVALIQHKNGYYNLKLNIGKDTSSAVAITYHIDSDKETYTEYVNVGDPMTDIPFTVEKEGYEFVGWRTDETASEEVLSEQDVANEELDLYAVFSKNITKTFVSYNNTETLQGTMYYNNGSIKKAKFKVPTGATRSGWNWRGWSAINDEKADADVGHDNGYIMNTTVAGTYYGLYSQDITVAYYDGNTTKKTVPDTTRYFSASGDISNPSIKLKQTELDGWNTRGWSTGTAGNSGIDYHNNVEFSVDSNITLYGMYYEVLTLSYYDGSSTKKQKTDNRYYNSGKGTYTDPSFVMSQTSLSNWNAKGWATKNVANADIVYNNGAKITISDDTTIYGRYNQTITLSYNGNGSTGGSTTSQNETRYYNSINYSNPKFKLNSNGFSKTNCTFQKWAQGNITGTQYAVGAEVTLTASTVFYAIWYAAPVSKVLYSGTGGILSNNVGSFNTTGFKSVTITLIASSGWSYYGLRAGKDACGAGDWTEQGDSATITISLPADAGVQYFSWMVNLSSYGGTDENTSWQIKVNAS